MNKIPTIFLRDLDDMARVTREPNPACAWVFDGEGTPTRKYDGTCVMYDGARWWARREVKPGKAEPDGYVLVTFDALTGKSMGWEPIERSAWLKTLIDAHERAEQHDPEVTYPAGTYELCGPRVNRNPEGYMGHTLIRHAGAELLLGVPRDFDGLAEWLADCEFEGIVWHHPDGRMSKIKRKDFPAAAAPATQEGPQA